jgi:cytidyltransferase-like protein
MGGIIIKVMATGTFDIIHPGHGFYLEKAKKLGGKDSVLMVVIATDKTVEKQVQMLAQKSRAAGIHLIIATQRPSVDVITGTIKANLPTRLSYKVSSPADSMTILNTVGAEDLLGRGDSLLLEENGTLTRVLGAYMPNVEIMQMLEPHRCHMDSPHDWYLKPTAASGEVVSAGSASTPTTIPSTEEQKKVGLWTRICSWWNRIGKRQQNKIINWVLTAIFAALQAKNASQKARSTTSTMRKLTSSSKTTRRR